MEFLLESAVTILSDDIGILKSRKRKFIDGGTTNKSSKAVRKWCYYAHFYSTLEQPYFNDNEFVKCLSQLGFSHIEKATITNWRTMRQQIGSKIGQPRRLSKPFLDTERRKLQYYREEVRLYQSTKTLDSNFPFQMKEAIHVGDTVIVYFSKLSQFCQGCVLSSIPNSLNSANCFQYLIQLEEQQNCIDSAITKPIIFKDEFIYVIKNASSDKIQPLFQQVSRQLSTSSRNSDDSLINSQFDDISTVNFSNSQINENSSLFFNSQVFNSQKTSTAIIDTNISDTIDDKGPLSQNTLLSQSSTSTFPINNNYNNNENMITTKSKSIHHNNDDQIPKFNIQTIWQQQKDISKNIIEKSIKKMKLNNSSSSDMESLKAIQLDTQIFELYSDCLNTLLVLSHTQVLDQNQSQHIVSDKNDLLLKLSQMVGGSSATCDNKNNKYVCDALSYVVKNCQL